MSYRVTGGRCACLKDESCMNRFGLVDFKSPFSEAVLHFREVNFKISGN